MRVILNWQSAMKFKSTVDGNDVMMDAKSPIGQGSAMTPKELVAAGLGGCTAMDVIALFKKYKQNPTSFEVTVDVETSKGSYPAVFTNALITFTATGNVEKDVYINAVEESQTKFCGVSAMLSKAFPIQYKVVLNNDLIHEGTARFSS